MSNMQKSKVHQASSRSGFTSTADNFSDEIASASSRSTPSPPPRRPLRAQKGGKHENRQLSKGSSQSRPSSSKGSSSLPPQLMSQAVSRGNKVQKRRDQQALTKKPPSHREKPLDTRPRVSKRANSYPRELQMQRSPSEGTKLPNKARRDDQYGRRRKLVFVAGCLSWDGGTQQGEKLMDALVRKVVSGGDVQSAEDLLKWDSFDEDREAAESENAGTKRKRYDGKARRNDGEILVPRSDRKEKKRKSVNFSPATDGLEALRGDPAKKPLQAGGDASFVAETSFATTVSPIDEVRSACEFDDLPSPYSKKLLEAVQVGSSFGIDDGDQPSLKDGRHYSGIREIGDSEDILDATTADEDSPPRSRLQGNECSNAESLIDDSIFDATTDDDTGQQAHTSRLTDSFFEATTTDDSQDAQPRPTLPRAPFMASEMDNICPTTLPSAAASAADGNNPLSASMRWEEETTYEGESFFESSFFLKENLDDLNGDRPAASSGENQEPKPHEPKSSKPQDETGTEAAAAAAAASFSFLSITPSSSFSSTATTTSSTSNEPSTPTPSVWHPSVATPATVANAGKRILQPYSSVPVTSIASVASIFSPETHKDGDGAVAKRRAWQPQPPAVNVLAALLSTTSSSPKDIKTRDGRNTRLVEWTVTDGSSTAAQADGQSQEGVYSQARVSLWLDPVPPTNQRFAVQQQEAELRETAFTAKPGDVILLLNVRPSMWRERVDLQSIRGRTSAKLLWSRRGSKEEAALLRRESFCRPPTSGAKDLDKARDGKRTILSEKGIVLEARRVRDWVLENIPPPPAEDSQASSSALSSIGKNSQGNASRDGQAKVLANKRHAKTHRTRKIVKGIEKVLPADTQ